jgi:hypothetical protein
MKVGRFHIALFSVGLCLMAPLALAGGDGINRTTEKELHVVLSAGFGKITIERGPSDKIFSSERSDDKSHGFSTVYNVRNRTGYLEIELGEEKKREGEKKKGVHITFGGEWTLRFTDAIPISFDIELGVAQGRIELAGLQVKDFNLSCGASDVTLTCDEPNPIPMNEMSIECGVSKFTGQNLGNANFKRFRFQGGVGAATLDFDGEKLAEKVEADIEVGLGACTIVLPREVGTKIYYEDSFVSHISLANDIHGSDENEYISDNFKNARSHLVLNVRAGMGSVKVKRK